VGYFFELKKKALLAKKKAFVNFFFHRPIHFLFFIPSITPSRIEKKAKSNQHN